MLCYRTTLFTDSFNDVINPFGNTVVVSIPKLDVSKVVQHEFDQKQFYKSTYEKKQITVHHTVSGEKVDGDLTWWDHTPARVATALIVDREGVAHQPKGFSTRYWAHHLGIESDFLKEQGFKDYGKRNDILNRESIGVEMDSWGGLIKESGQWYPEHYQKPGEPWLAKGSIPEERVVEYPDGYRGYYGFEKYTKSQLKTTMSILIYLSNRYDIPLDYNPEMWDVSHNALAGEEGVWTHTSYRPDKSDCHPQEELVNWFKVLKYFQNLDPVRC